MSNSDGRDSAGISTHPLEEAAEHFGNSPEWLAQQLRSRRFSGYKVGRKWRMSDADIADALEKCRRDARPSTTAGEARPTVGLVSATPTTQRRFAS
ncbi:helix-turn-helix domain-containing protein [Mycobacteroides chelonae]|uniref:helix-turn-helix domain-containing protein n=1 Tax=Mycobacteroides chelonae TaxID=1774 RepID=UPI0008A8F978|nr:helix-turn-helix domain-containing protein [Mycobacteroides chelonae]OHU48143.1 DNA-binding protein [Mycobacteroides chelonae]